MKKLIRIFFTTAFAMIFAVGFTGCSQHEDEPKPKVNPDIAFKGDINDELLTSLSNGEVMSGLDCKYAEIYSRSADNSDNTNDEWELIRTEKYKPVTGGYLNSIWRFNLEKIFIKKGHSLIYDRYVRNHHPRLPILYLVWWDYKWFSSHTEPVLGYKSDFIYNKAERKLTLNGNTFSVERCDDKNLVLSFEETTDTDEYGNSIPMQRLKYIFVCSPLSSYIYEPVSVSYELSFITMFESESELKLHMLKELREQFGDKLEPEDCRGYTLIKKIDLVKYEEDIRNGVPDEHYMYKYRD